MELRYQSKHISVSNSHEPFGSGRTGGKPREIKQRCLAAAQMTLVHLAWMARERLAKTFARKTVMSVYLFESISTADIDFDERKKFV